MENNFICYSSDDEFIIQDKESDRYLDKYEVFAYLNEQNRQIADLEAKLAESEKLNKRLQQVIDKLRDKEFAGETLVNAVNAVYEPLYQNKYDEVEQLKQQLAEKDAEVQSWKDGTMVVKLGKLEEQLAEKDQAHMKAMQNAFNDFLQLRKEQNQTAIAVLEEMLENEIYLNVIPDFECGDYVSSKIIKTKIEELKNGRN